MRHIREVLRLHHSVGMSQRVVARSLNLAQGTVSKQGSLLSASQVPLAQWHDIIADPTLGGTILDRIVHNANRIELKRTGTRRRRSKRRCPDDLIMPGESGEELFLTRLFRPEREPSNFDSCRATN
jgi:hypothetical protein